MEDRKFYVYIDWTDEENPRPFYVGKGMMRRVRQKTRSKHHRNISAKYGCDRAIAFMTDNESEAFEMEIKLIAEHKTFVYADDYGGFGCNYTSGGEGPSGGTHSVSSETRALLSQQKIGNKNATGYRKTNQQRLNQSNSMKGHSVSAETRNKIRQSLKNRNSRG